MRRMNDLDLKCKDLNSHLFFNSRFVCQPIFVSLFKYNGFRFFQSCVHRTSFCSRLTTKPQRDVLRRDP